MSNEDGAVTAKPRAGLGRLFSRLTGSEVAKVTAKCDPSKVIDRIAGELVSKVTESDAVLRHIVEHQDSKPDISQMAYFASLGWDTKLNSYHREPNRKSLRVELARMRRVVRFQAVCGTKADRAALAKEAERAKQELRTKGEEIREQLTKLDAHLKRLESTANTAERRLTEAEQAAQNLRDSLPDEIEMAVSQARAIVKQSMGNEHRELEARRATLQGIVDMPVNSHAIINYCEQHHRDMLDRHGSVVRESWDALVRKSRAELDKILPKCEQAKADFEAALEAASAPRDFYLV